MKMGRPKAELLLTDDERSQLQAFARSRSVPAALRQRARIVLGSTAGEPNNAIAERLKLTNATVGKWRSRFIERRIAGLYDDARPGKPRMLTDDRLGQLIQAVVHTQPADGSPHWSVRAVAAATGISKSRVARYFQHHGLRPRGNKASKLAGAAFFGDELRAQAGLLPRPQSAPSAGRPDFEHGALGQNAVAPTPAEPTDAHFALQPSLGTTLYSQLASVLRGRIARGEWAVGHEIPTLDELSAAYGVARVSARQAVQMLVNEGLLAARRGRRTTVIRSGLYERTRSTGVAAPLEQLPGFNARIVERVRAVSLPAFAEGLGQPDTSYVRIRKIDREGEAPYAYSNIYVARSIFDRFPAQAEERVKISRLVRTLSRSPLISARERITVSSASPEEAAALQCPLSAPIAIAQRVYVDARGYVIYAGWSTYRSDRFLVDRELLELVHGDITTTRGRHEPVLEPRTQEPRAAADRTKRPGATSDTEPQPAARRRKPRASSP